MKTIRSILTCVLLSVLIASAIYGILLLRAAERTISALPAHIDAQISATRDAALSAITDTRRETLSEIANLRKDTLTRVDNLTGVADRQLTGLRGDVMGQVAEFRTVADRRIGDTLARADTALNQVTELRGQIAPILTNTAAITGHANEASAILFRRDALPAQLLGLTAAAKVTLGETARTMKVVREAAPQFVTQGQAVATNFNAITTNINRLTKPHWYDRLLGYGLNGAILFRELHPATNLTLKGVEYISSQK